jgi:hypothetical protein
LQKNRQAPGELERDRAYYVSKQGRKIMQRSLVLLLELGRGRYAGKRASERASKGNEEQESKIFVIYFLWTQGRGPKRVCSR